jgi:hypothetical protein
MRGQRGEMALELALVKVSPEVYYVPKEEAIHYPNLQSLSQ